MICNGDDSYPTIVHNLSRYEFVNRSSKDLYIQHQPKRLNAGGCLLIEGEIEFQFDLSPFELSDLLLGYMESGNANMELMEKFIHSLEQLNENAPYRTKNVPNCTSGSKILSRLIAISNLNKDLNAKEWTKEEIDVINCLLLQNRQISLEICDQFKCTEKQLKRILEIQKIELSKRNWSQEEDKIIIDHLSTTIKNKDLAKMLICRTVNDIKKRRALLKKQFKQL